MTSAKMLLTYLAIKYEGNWDLIMKTVSMKQMFPESELYEEVSKLKCKVMTILDEDYPECLKHSVRPPFVLFYYGDISLLKDYRKNLSVVGSRENSKYAKRMVEKVINELNGEYNIVSGLAYGIDTIAHTAAIKSGAKTIAILGCGIDNCYPLENYELYEEIKKNHLVISEYPNKVIPDKSHFPLRNRLIAALSYGLLVGEAKNRSGTMITVMHALENDREVMCIPFPVYAECECNKLIRSGATLVESGDHIREAMGNYSKILK